MMAKLIRWTPAIVWMTLIYYMSDQPGGELATYMPFFQRFFPGMKDFNWGHFIAYFILALTFYWALGGKGANWRGRAAVVVLCVLYGLTDEYHQRFVSERTPDWMDIRNDAVGACLAMLTVSFPPVAAFYRKWTHTNKY